MLMTIESALTSIRSFLAAKVVLYDKRELLIDGVYIQNESGRTP